MKKIESMVAKNSLENIIYLLSLLFLYVLHTSLNLIKSYQFVPVGLLIVCIVISMFKDVVISCVYGLFAGILCDISLNLPLGLSCLFVVFMCGIISMMTIYYIKINFFSFVAFSFIIILVEQIITLIYQHYCGIVDAKLLPVFFGGLVRSVTLGALLCPPIFYFSNYINNRLLNYDNYKKYTD